MIGGGVLVVVGLVVFLNFNRIKLMFKGYSFSQQNTILKSYIKLTPNKRLFFSFITCGKFLANNGK